MSSTNFEFVEEWNNIIPFKISESDLSKPNENFLKKALVSYLQMLNIDFTNLITLEDPSLIRKFQIQLCFYIDHLLKLSYSSYNFYYYELLHPPPKKTIHMLQILLNYLHYVNMVGTEVLEKANPIILERDNLLHLKNELQLKNEQSKLRGNGIKNQMFKLNSELPQLKLEFKQVEKTNAELENDLKNYEIEMKNLNYNLSNILSEEQKIRDRMVTESEINYLEQHKTTVEKKLEVLEENEKACYESGIQISNSIKNLEECNLKLEKSINLLSEIDLSYEKNNKLLCNEYETELKLEKENSLSLKNISDTVQKLEMSCNEQISIKQTEITGADNMLSNIKTNCNILKHEQKAITNIIEKKQEIYEDLKAERANMISMAEEVFLVLTNSTEI